MQDRRRSIRPQQHPWRKSYAQLVQSAMKLGRQASRDEGLGILRRARPLLEEMLAGPSPESTALIEGLFARIPSHMGLETSHAEEVFGVAYQTAIDCAKSGQPFVPPSPVSPQIDYSTKPIEELLGEADLVARTLIKSQPTRAMYEQGLVVQEELKHRQEQGLPSRWTKKVDRQYQSLTRALSRTELRNQYGLPPDCVWTFSLQKPAHCQEELRDVVNGLNQGDKPKLDYLFDPTQLQHLQWVFWVRGHGPDGRRMGMVLYSPVRGMSSLKNPSAQILYPDVVNRLQVRALPEYRDQYMADIVAFLRRPETRQMVGESICVCWPEPDPSDSVLKRIQVKKISRWATGDGSHVGYYAVALDAPYTQGIRLNWGNWDR